MTTIIISAKATKQNDDLLFLDLTYQGRSIEMTAKTGMSLAEMAQLAIDQPFPELPDTVFDGVVQIDFHVDSEGRKIVDSAVKV
jgi:hypothetical protein